MAKKHRLNVRAHLDHAAMILNGIEKYGWCPLVEDELRKFKLYNQAIIAKHDRKKADGDRHDIRL